MPSRFDAEFLDLCSSDPARRRSAAEWFSRQPPAGASLELVETLAARVEDSDEATRRFALRALVELAHPQNREIAADLAGILARIGQPAAEAILDELGAWDREAMVRYLHFYEAKAEALAAIGRPALGPILRGLPHVRKPEARRALVRALGALGADEAIPSLLALVVEGGVPGLEASKSLQALGEPLGYLLRRVLGDDPRAGREGQRDALENLRRLAPRQAIPALLGGIHLADRRRWERVLEALRALAAPQLPSALLECLARRDSLKLPATVRVLKDVGSAADLDRACAILSDWLEGSSDPDLACAATDALGYLGNPRALPALRRRASFWSRPAELRRRAREAIAQIEAFNLFARK